MRLLVLLGFLLVGSAAFGDVAYRDALALFKKHGVRYEEKSVLLDEAFVSKVESGFRETGRRKTKGALRGLRGGLNGATLHMLRYRNSRFVASLIERDGMLLLASFHMPIFSLTGAPPPKGYVEVGTDIASLLTERAVSASGFEAELGASIEEAHAYAEKRSKLRYPGVIFKKTASFNYSARALVPDYVTLTATRFGQCGYGYKQNGWILEHICAKAR